MVGAGTRAPVHLFASVVGMLLMLIGSVLPWLRGPDAIWGWDVSVFWPMTGDLGALHVPPSLGAVVFGVALLLAVPVLRGRPVSGPVSAGLAGLVVAVAGLSLLRAFTYPQPVYPHIGLFSTFVGAMVVAVAALMRGD